MDASYQANPRFDPQRNAAELGLDRIPVFFLGGAVEAGSTDPTATERPDYASQIPWVRLGVLAAVVFVIWKLGK